MRTKATRRSPDAGVKEGDVTEATEPDPTAPEVTVCRICGGANEPPGACQLAALELVAVRTLPEAGVPVTVMPPTDVAALLPVPDTAIDAPDPTVIVAEVFVPEVMAENAAPPPETPQAPPAS